MGLDPHSSKRPASDFALSKGHFPIYDEKHAKLALNPFFLRNASAKDQKTIRKNVYSKYPHLKSRSDTNKAFSEGSSNDKGGKT